MQAISAPQGKATSTISSFASKVREKVTLRICDPKSASLTAYQNFRVNAEYADLKFYADANQIDRHHYPGRVVFFGDSITGEWPKNSSWFSAGGYICRGIGGQTTVQMVSRFRQDVIGLRPDVVVILAGTNDIGYRLGSPDIATGNIQTMAELANLHGIKVILCSVPPQSLRSPIPGRSPQSRIVAFNAWLASYTESNGYGFADFHDDMADAKGMLKIHLSADGVHPNAEGYRLMESVLKAQLHKALWNHLR